MPSKLARTISILTVAATLAGCGSGRPSASQTSRPEPTAIQRPSPSPAPPTVQPTRDCAATAPEPSDAILNIRTLESIEEIDLEEAAGLPTLAPVATQEPNAALGLGTVLGGSPVQASLFADEGATDQPIVTSVNADFVPFGAAAALPVQVSVDGTKVVLELPDDDASGMLRVAIAWTGTCGDGAAAGEIALRVLDSSVAAGCPAAEDALIESMASLAGTRYQFGTVEVPLSIVGWSGRWLLASGVTDGPQFAPWDRDAVIVVAPGAEIIVRESVADLELLNVRTAMYERSVIDAYLEPDSTTELTTYDSIRRSAGSHGRVRIPAPLEAGRYVFETQGTWQTSCLDLVTYTTFSVEVR